MRKAILLFVLAISSTVFTGCTSVPPGYVGIKINQYGTYRGVQDIPIVTGRVFYNPFTEDIDTFPTFLQNRVWTASTDEGKEGVDESITFNTVKGAAVNCDISVSTQFDGGKVPELYVKFRKDADYITDVYVRSIVRNSFSKVGGKMDVIDIMGPHKSDLETAVLADVNSQLQTAGIGISIEQLSIVGKIRVDKSVEDSINRVIQAQQDAQAAQAKVAQIKAEADQKIAEAEGQARALALVRQNITPMLLQKEQLDNQKSAIDKWDGAMPQVSGGVTPFINFNLKALKATAPAEDTTDDSQKQ